MGSRRQVSVRAAVGFMSLMVAMLGLPPTVAGADRGRGPVISRIDPTCAGPGATVTVFGRKFGKEPTVFVGKKVAAVAAASRTRIAFTVPNVKPAEYPVRVVNRDPSHPVPLTVPCVPDGRLPGSPEADARGAIIDVPPTPASPDDVSGRVILSRLTVYLEATATVGAVNQLLADIDGRIVASAAGQPMLSVAVPRQPDAAALDALAARVTGSDAVIAAIRDELPTFDNVPETGFEAVVEALERTRFPAAWNALALARDGCASRRVPVIVADDFGREAPPGFSGEVPGFRPNLTNARDGVRDHGYLVTSVLASNFTGPMVGAAPLPECLELVDVNLAAPYTALERTLAISEAVGRFPRSVVNASWGFPSLCGDSDGNATSCDATTVEPYRLYFRATQMADWKAVFGGAQDRFVAAVSAGNGAQDPETLHYPGTIPAGLQSTLGASALADPTFAEFTDPALWDPTDPALPDVTLTGANLDSLEAILDITGARSIPPFTNTLVVGSSSATGVESAFSNPGATVRAVGEAVFATTWNNVRVNGTSFAAPQVAGLAAYLWLLSPDLRARPAPDTANLIRLSTDPDHPGELDALTAVLALDASTADPTPANSPVRLAMLDIDDDGDFDDDDLSAFRTAYLDENGDRRPSERDLGRFDLNGDGFRSANGTEANLFDLNRATSTRFGETVYENDLVKDIDGASVDFYEELTTDGDVVCYYAYSPLFTGDQLRRQETIGALCGEPNLQIVPDDPTVDTGETLQFVAAVQNAEDETVTWTASAGSISQTGLFTAPNTPGTVTVTASLVSDPTVQDSVTVTVVGPLVLVAQGFSFTPATLSGTAGLVTLVLDNRASGIQHNVRVHLTPTRSVATAVAAGPNTRSIEFSAGVGDYSMTCDVHSGMSATLALR